jgi:hypothetical protein
LAIDDDFSIYPLNGVAANGNDPFYSLIVLPTQNHEIIVGPVCPVSAIFTLDDLPEKWKHYAELNASYVEGGKFKKEEYAKHEAAQ